LSGHLLAASPAPLQFSPAGRPFCFETMNGRACRIQRERATFWPSPRKWPPPPPPDDKAARVQQLHPSGATSAGHAWAMQIRAAAATQAGRPAALVATNNVDAAHDDDDDDDGDYHHYDWLSRTSPSSRLMRAARGREPARRGRESSCRSILPVGLRPVCAGIGSGRDTKRAYKHRGTN
jgi:hypothetical protein